MRRIALALLTSAGFGLASGAAANAADIPVKAPPRVAAAVAPFYNWSGFYVGGNVGYSFGRIDADQNIRNPPAPPALPDQPFKLRPDGWLAGGQIGFNWQPGSNLVVGIEADWQWTNQKDDSACLTPGGANGGVCIPGTLLLTVEAHPRWFATLRGRIGYAHDRWLFYVTGGGAWAKIKESDVIAFASFPAPVSFSETKGGWAVGGGIEAALWGNWTAKFEYLHLDLGRTSHSFGAPGGTSIQTVNFREIRDHIVRVGLNYKFDAPAAVVARY